MTTGERIAERRQAAGLSRKELAERSGVSDRTLEKIEQNVVAEPKLVDVAAVARVLGGTCADYLPDASPPPPPTPVGRPKSAASSPPKLQTKKSSRKSP